MFNATKKFRPLQSIFALGCPLAMALCLSLARPAQACSPIEGSRPTPIAERLRETPYVFEGTVVQTHDNAVTVRVNRYFKGQGTKVVKLAGFFQDSCGFFPGETGDHFLFFGDNLKGNGTMEAVFDGAFGSARSWSEAVERELTDLSDPLPTPPTTLEELIQQSGFPQPHLSHSVWLEIPEQDLKLFRFTWGQPMDCPMGCIYNQAVAIQHRGKIGWISVQDYSRQFDRVQLPFYDFNETDAYLYSEEFWQLLQTRDPWLFQYAFLPRLAQDIDTPKSALIRIARGLSDTIRLDLAQHLLGNSTVQEDFDLVLILSTLPVFKQDVYQSVRDRATSLLPVQLGDEARFPISSLR